MSDGMQAGGDAAAKLKRLRVERDRFVAFAFCSADLLMECTPDKKIAFSGGATKALIGRSGEELLGKPLVSLFEEKDRPLINDLLDRATKGEPFADVRVHFKMPDGPGKRVNMSGYVLPRLQHRFFLIFKPTKNRNTPRGDGASGRRFAGPEEGEEFSPLAEPPQKSGLHDGDSFAQRISQLAKSADHGEEVKLTYFDLNNADQLRSRLDERAWNKLESTVTTALQAAAVDGDTAGKFGDDRFGVVTGADFDIQSLESQIEQAAKQADPKGIGVQVHAASVDVPKVDPSDTDAAQALIYTIKRLSENDDGELTVEKLSEALSNQMKETTLQMARVKAAIANKHFKVAYQPIVALEDAHCHHYEALVRFDKDGIDMNPFEFITFAEDTGIVADFDITMARTVVSDIKAALKKTDDIVGIAVNMSGRSLGSPAFIAELRELLRENPEVRGHMLFEVTESARIRDLEAANRFIQILRGQGFEVCLDDFGAGESAFEYLRALDVDFVKIDGSYVDFATEDPKGKAFLKAMSMLCRDLRIETIAEKIEDMTMVHFLRTVGVQYGQGYFYGKPLVGQSLASAESPEMPPEATNAA